jgi:hypothetical protein
MPLIERALQNDVNICSKRPRIPDNMQILLRVIDRGYSISWYAEYSGKIRRLFGQGDGFAKGRTAVGRFHAENPDHIVLFKVYSSSARTVATILTARAGHVQSESWVVHRGTVRVSR